LLVDRCHQEGIGVILNWMPVRFPDDPQTPVRFDGPALYEHPDPQEQRRPQWNTLIYNYGRPGVCNDLSTNALFWLDCYHIDGLASILYLDYGGRYRATARLNAEGALGQITRERLRTGVMSPCLKGGNARNRYLPNRYSPLALSSLISASQRLRSLPCPYIRA
jgi:1,4-alpha-glucan branching enzyme